MSQDIRQTEKKMIICLCASNEKMDTKINSAIPFIIPQKNEIVICKTNKTCIGLIC